MLHCVTVFVTVLQCVAVCCSVLWQRNIVHYVAISTIWSLSCRHFLVVNCVLQRVTACCIVLHCVAVCCSVLQRVAACCSVLYHVALCCSVYRVYLVVDCAMGRSSSDLLLSERAYNITQEEAAVCCSVLLRDTAYCSVLQCVAICCIILYCVAVCH